MKNTFKVLAINPGSTSTKVALFEGDKKVFSANVAHNAQKLSEFKEISDQFEYRKETVLAEVQKQGIDLTDIDAFSGRGGGLRSLVGGTYKVNDIMLEHARIGLTVKHPATLGCQLANFFAELYNKKAFVVNPPDVDEFQEVARITGLKGVYRESRIHALNQKEIGIRYASNLGKNYNELNLIVAHIGGGVSVTAHKRGKMIDSNDIVNGDGPMAPTRCGSLPVTSVIKMCYSGQYTEKEMLQKATKTGGLLDHLGTADVLEVVSMIEKGDNYAKLIFDTMIYQIIKAIGSNATALSGEVDGIILTGGISHSDYVVNEIKKSTAFIAPVVVMAGEFEMEALAAGAIRVMKGEEIAKIYDGEPVWKGVS